jgi:hypothetical protein
MACFQVTFTSRQGKDTRNTRSNMPSFRWFFDHIANIGCNFERRRLEVKHGRSCVERQEKVSIFDPEHISESSNR